MCGREDPWDRHGDDRSPVVRSNLLTRCPDPGSDTPASMGHERLMVLPFAFYPLTSSFPPHGISPKIFPFVSIFPPTLHSAAVLSNIPVARRSNELQLRFTFLSNLGPSSHH